MHAPARPTTRRPDRHTGPAGPARPRERPLSAILLAAAEGGGYTPPSIEEFYPPALVFGGTIFEINRVMMVKLIGTVALIGFFFLAFRTPRGRPQGAVERR